MVMKKLQKTIIKLKIELEKNKIILNSLFKIILN